MLASVRVIGFDEALTSIAADAAVASQRGAADELVEVVAAARGSWPRDTGASATQLVVVETEAGGRVDLGGYAPFVHRAGTTRESWRELIADRIEPERAAERIARGVDG